MAMTYFKYVLTALIFFTHANIYAKGSADPGPQKLQDLVAFKEKIYAEKLQSLNKEMAAVQNTTDYLKLLRKYTNQTEYDAFVLLLKKHKVPFLKEFPKCTADDLQLNCGKHTVQIIPGDTDEIKIDGKYSILIDKTKTFSQNAAEFLKYLDNQPLPAKESLFRFFLMNHAHAVAFFLFFVLPQILGAILMGLLILALGIALASGAFAATPGRNDGLEITCKDKDTYKICFGAERKRCVEINRYDTRRNIMAIRSFFQRKISPLEFECTEATLTAVNTAFERLAERHARATPAERNRKLSPDQLRRRILIEASK